MAAKARDRSGRTDTAESTLGPRPKTAALSRIPDWAILLLFCLLFAGQTILSLQEKSATFDETDHLPSGYVYWRTGDYALNPEHPPFVKLLASFPLLFLDIKMPPLSSQIGPEADFAFGRRLLYQVNDGDRLLFLGRLAVLPLAMLLGCVLFRWTRDLFGREAAVAALFLFTFEPNVVAHAPLVNTDFGATCFMFLTVYGFYLLVRRVSIARLLFAGGALGLALITKFSTLQLLPILALLGGVAVLTSHAVERRPKGSRPRFTAGRTQKLFLLSAYLLGMGWVALGMIWAVYDFRFGGGFRGGLPVQFPWNAVLGSSWTAGVLSWMREARLLPESYLYGLAHVFRMSTRVTFLMGQITHEGWWYFFIVSFLLKTPLPLLLLLAAAPLALRSAWRENRMAILFLLVPVVVCFGIASASRLNIGHRHILPIYPFLFVLVSSLVPWLLQQKPVIKVGAAALAAWYLITSVAIFPHYLAYFNELAGGPGNGYKFLVDSNLDWGQDLKGLKRYMQDHKIGRVWLSYFGTARPEYYGITYNYLPGYWMPDQNDEAVRTPFVAISATNLQGVYFPDTLGLDADFFKSFRERQPVSKIGYSIFLYRNE